MKVHLATTTDKEEEGNMIEKEEGAKMTGIGKDRHHHWCMIVVVIIVDHSRVNHRVAIDRRCQYRLHTHIHRRHHRHIHADGNVNIARRKRVEEVVRVKRRRNQRSPSIIIAVNLNLVILLEKKKGIMTEVWLKHLRKEVYSQKKRNRNVWKR
jgi:hypothetical protein